MGVSHQDYRVMTGAPKADKNYYLEFPDFNSATWLSPKLVCRVEYMERTTRGGLRQPVSRGLRDDKTTGGLCCYGDGHAGRQQRAVEVTGGKKHFMEKITEILFDSLIEYFKDSCYIL